MIKQKNYNKVKDLAVELGAVAFGVCDIKEEKNNFNISKKGLEGLDLAVSVAVGLSRKVLDEIIDKPTRLYFHHYRQANSLLDHIATRLTGLIQEEGFNAMPIPASQIVDWQKQTAHLSHKRIAQLAGVGWLGRHNIVAHPKYGAHIRLVTVLTDMPLPLDKQIEDGCLDCKACITACPAAAIKESPKDFDHLACFEKLKSFQRERIVDQFICGVCVRACKGK